MTMFSGLKCVKVCLYDYVPFGCIFYPFFVEPSGSLPTGSWTKAPGDRRGGALQQEKKAHPGTVFHGQHAH